jgi:hypothetical protein
MRSVCAREWELTYHSTDMRNQLFFWDATVSHQDLSRLSTYGRVAVTPVCVQVGRLSLHLRHCVRHDHYLVPR